MATESSRFIFFRSQPVSGAKLDDPVDCLFRDGDVLWPGSKRRGRPRKNPPNASFQAAQALAAPSYAFVDCSDTFKPTNPAKRRFIRTHVMRYYQHRKVGCLIGNDSGCRSSTQTNAENAVFPSSLPRLLSWEPFDCFPLKMQPYMHDLFYQYVYIASSYLYSLEARWGFNPTQKVWIPMALADPILLSAILLSCEQFLNRIKAAGVNQFTISHLTQTIRALNGRLESSQRPNDTTIAAVAGLALLEQWGGHQSIWRIHMEGLRKMMVLRAQPLTFEREPVLFDKVCRADICGSLHDFSQPYVSLALHEHCQVSKNLVSGFQDVHEEYEFDAELINVLLQAQRVDEDVNIIRPLPSETFPMHLRERLRCIQYSLLGRMTTRSQSNEMSHCTAVAIGILIYAGIIQNEFQLSPVSYRLKEQFVSCIKGGSFATNSMRALRLWLLFLADSIVHDAKEKAWLSHSVVEMALKLHLSHWDDVKKLLRSFVWAENQQDKNGRLLWETTCQQDTGVWSRISI
ncbi:uncharacterized protein PV09_08296 [Verruconis gallopava]|uniref:Transcription factor domain-containing protein n=1 Tax=Verruconis gallopava TaxID=253628 RepID=A0A0D2ALW5_9PEZI|nr:uncharacterized protein PV09_08296 [Verruconis gallopava]KIW00114.1 hypothetical protein PV09_08296 [Verruconis gallopava]